MPLARSPSPCPSESSAATRRRRRRTVRSRARRCRRSGISSSAAAAIVPPATDGRHSSASAPARQRARILLVDPLREVETQHARGLRVALEEPAVRNRLKARLRPSTAIGTPAAGANSDSAPYFTSTGTRMVGIHRRARSGSAASSFSVSSVRSFARSLGRRRGRGPLPPKPRRPNPPRPRPHGRQAARPIGARQDVNRVEHAGLREAPDELILQPDAERDHAGKRRDPDRHAEHRQRRAQLRLAEIPEREVDRVSEASRGCLPTRWRRRSPRRRAS